jgi:hypothetical protein
MRYPLFRFGIYHRCNTIAHGSYRQSPKPPPSSTSQHFSICHPRPIYTNRNHDFYHLSAKLTTLDMMPMVNKYKPYGQVFEALQVVSRTANSSHLLKGEVRTVSKKALHQKVSTSSSWISLQKKLSVNSAQPCFQPRCYLA